MTEIVTPFQQFFGTDGAPLNNGAIFIGAAFLDAQSNPIPVYWDDALTIPAIQPIRTLNGYPSRNGTPAKLYSSQADYSITVRTSNNTFVYSSPSQTNVTSIGVDWANVKGYGAIGNGLSDDTPAFLNALATGKPVYVPSGTYKITSGLTISTNGQRIFGDGPFESAIKPEGNFDVVTFADAVEAPSLQNVSFDCSGMFGGYIVSVMGADRWSVRNVRGISAWNFLYCQASNTGLIADCYAGNMRGDVVIRWFGNDAIRSDILDVQNSYFSAVSGNNSMIGFDWDGNCWSPSFSNVLFLDGARGIWKRNSSGSTLKGGLGNFYNVNCEDQVEYSVYLEDGQGFAFSNSYLFGADIDAFYVENSVADVRVSNSVVGGTNGYAFNIEAGALEIAVTNCDLTSSTLGAFNDQSTGGNNNVIFNSNQGSNVTLENQTWAATSGWGARASATLSGSAVATVTVNSGGWNYQVAPTISFIGGGGSGATATATVAGGKITAITVISGGSGYTSSPSVRIVAVSQSPAMGSFSRTGAAANTNLGIFAANVGTLSLGNEAQTGMILRETYTDLNIPVRLPLYTIATLPAASSMSRAIAYVSDGAASKRLVVSDGVVWRYPDGAAV
jgi:hypothetical protein